MGLFSKEKLIAAATINFYSETEANLNYSAECVQSPQLEADQLQFFALYYAKILFNLCAVPAPEMNLRQGDLPRYLVILIQGLVADTWNNNELNRESIASRDIRLVDDTNRPVVKLFKGEFLQKKNGSRYAKTPMSLKSMGGEGYFAPSSVLVFLMSLIQSLPADPLCFLLLMIQEMNTFYLETEKYSDPSSMFVSVQYGQARALEIIAELQNN